MYELFFKQDHRIGRAKFWFGFLLIEVIFVVGDLVFGHWLLGLNTYNLDLAPEQLAEPRYLWANFALWLILIYPNYAVLVKRCHDRNRGFPWIFVWLLWETTFALLEAAGLIFATTESSWLDDVYLVSGGPVLLWIIIDLGILRGTKGPNRFGPDPLEVAE